MIWMAELENQSAALSKQKPGTFGFQNLATGTQFAQALTTDHVPYTARKPRRMLQARRIRGVEKTRRYCKRIEILVQNRLL